MNAEGKVRQNDNDSTGFVECRTNRMEIGGESARKMEAKSIMIFPLLPVDLLAQSREKQPRENQWKKGEAFTSPGVRLTHT
ncbi:hypothetical protein SU60_15140 [Vibrio mytili]|uniref:Uncharacterized protein n=1 Tax=Vibrio mytili TaxID=50718 RepID=A0A0C3DFR1_9VIBR|nr:hypothetical protein SU60_15140 [Vibrio mytili]